MKKIEFKKEFWCIVTARRNSKSIKRKNLVKIKGKELIKYSFDVIKKVNKIKKTIVTTDDEKIKKISTKYNYFVIDRKKSLSGDKVNSVNVIIDVLKKSLIEFGYLPSYFFLIQPTLPFLQNEHLTKLINVLSSNKKYKSAQTIIKVPHQYHALNQRFFKKKQTGFIEEKKRLSMHNKQTKPKMFAYGNLIVSNTKLFLKNKNFFLKPSFGMLIPNIYGFDLDNKYDLKIASKILSKPLSYYEKD